jgi:hypothetical protein
MAPAARTPGTLEPSEQLGPLSVQLCSAGFGGANSQASLVGLPRPAVLEAAITLALHPVLTGRTDTLVTHALEEGTTLLPVVGRDVLYVVDGVFVEPRKFLRHQIPYLVCAS